MSSVKNISSFLFIILVLTFGMFVTLSAQTTEYPHAVNNGGGHTSSATMVTLGSIGQAVSGVDNRVSLVEKDGTTITPVYSGPVTIYKRDPKNTPNEYSLKQNSPNPFNASTKIEFTLPNSADVDFRVYNMAGEQVLNVQDHRGKGDYVLMIDSAELPSGLYVYSLKAGDFFAQKQMMLVK